MQILKERDVKVMRHLDVSNCNTFYAGLGHRPYGHGYDNFNVSRCLYNCDSSSKKVGCRGGRKSMAEELGEDLGRVVRQSVECHAR